MNFSHAHAPVTDPALMLHTRTYTRQFCFVLAYELAQMLPDWAVAETINEEDEGAMAHVFVVREDQYVPSGFLALDIQGLHDSQDLVEQFMADDWHQVNADAMLDEWTKDSEENGEDITDAMHAQANAVARALVAHLADELAL